MKIVYKDKNVIIVNKPVGVPSQSDPTGASDAMTEASSMLRELGEDDSLWLVHRLDRTVGGLIAFARNKKSAADLSEAVQNGNMEKKYLAVCHGIPTEGEYRDYLFKDSGANKAYIVKTERRGSKEARLNLWLLATADDKSLVSVKLDTGRFHQIRAQLSARSHPLVGDKKYGSRDSARRTPCLFSYKLSFELFGKSVSVKEMPRISEYPWNLFSEEEYTKVRESE